MKNTKFYLVASIALLSLCLPSQAVETLTEKTTKAQTTLKLSGIFADNMVIQRNTDAAIWGTALPKAKVTLKVSWLDKSSETTADDQGHWKITTPTPKAGGPHTINVQSGTKKLTIKNILSGEVWICSGQSNMQWKLRGFGPTEFKEDVDKANYPQIRLCHIPQVIALKAQNDVDANWTVCNPKSVMSFSAVAYFFGSRLHQELNVPIGLISTNWGGSAIEGWISPQILQKELPNYKEKTKNHPEWIKQHGAVIPGREKKPKGLNQSTPSVLYNSMIRPLIPFSFKGVIWYQGESNVARPKEYTKLFPAMIQDWRKRWNLGNFPFYYVQIAPYHYNYEKLPSALLREAQLKTLTQPNTGMVVTMDIGAEDNIHPKAKKPVGERLAKLALARDYGKKDLIASGPIYSKHQIEGDKIRLKFNYIGSGLTASNGSELTHFTIAGKDQKFLPAKALIDGSSLIISSDKVKSPVAVRFGWGDADEPNLANKEGLPASSFRTDTWPIEKKTKPKRKRPAKK